MARASVAVFLAVSTVASWVSAGDVVSETESTPYPGVRLVQRVESNPNNRIYVSFISLCTDHVEVVSTSPPSSYRTPGSWAGTVGVQVATNGDFYGSGPSVYGDAVGGGTHWPASQTGVNASGSWYYRNYGWIAFGTDWVEFSHSERTKTDDASRFGASLGWKPTEVTTDIPDGTVALVSGFPELVIEGQQYTCTSPTDSTCFPDRTDMRDRNPRTAMGITEDRKTFILAVVDGRSSSSLGMYGAELAELMFDLGAWEAFNLDGGGSSAMWVQGQGYVNSPSDGSARGVANHWGIKAGSGSGSSTDPASCFVPGGCFPTPLPGAEGEVFKDMPAGSLGHEEAISLLNAQITSGCSSTPQLFCPRCTLNRAQAVTFLVRAAGLDTSNPPSTPSFADVPVTSMFYAAIETAVAAGITSGCGGNNFCPTDPVTWAQMAALIRRTTGWSVVSPSTPTYGDVPQDHLFYDDIETITAQCVTDGCGQGDYCPDRNMNRARAAQFIARAFDLDDANPCLGASGAGGNGGGGTGGAGTSGSGGTGGSGTNPDGGTSGTGGTTPGSPGLDAPADDSGGCGCLVAGGQLSPGWTALSFLGLAWLGLKSLPR